MASTTTKPRSTRSPASRATSSRRGARRAQADPASLEGFADFCGLLKLEDGSPLVLHDFQRRMLADYFGGSTETLILVGKKNGKTTLLAALALHHLMVTPDAECVIAAASRDQAQVLLNQARGFVRRSGLARYVEVKQREIVKHSDEGRVRVMASDSDTADGVIPTLAIVDELHRHKDDGAMYGVFRDGLGPRHGRMVTISTAGDYEDSPLGRMRQAGYELPSQEREGAYHYCRSVDGAYVMHEWALDPDDDLDDLELVKTANPAPWQTVEALGRRHSSPSMTPWQWARFACGVWVAGEDAAVSALDWSRRGDSKLSIPRGAKDVWLGLDLGWKWDTTALVPLWNLGPKDHRVGRPAIVVPPRDGTSTREEDILDPILEFADRWQIAGVVLDPNAGGEQLAQRLEGDHGLRVIAHSQDPVPMALAAERLSRAIREGTLTHPNDPDLTAHVLAGQAKVVSGEKWRFVKPRRGGRVIDALIALAMVHSVVSDPPKSKPKPTFEVLA